MGQSPLGRALYLDENEDKDPYESENCMDVALYLMSRGCGYNSDKEKLLCAACRWGNLNLVKKLVEQHKVDPTSE